VACGEAGLGIRPSVDESREIVNAILHVARTGMVRAYLPHDFPPLLRRSVFDQDSMAGSAGAG
jgi:hypothetical protein